jgi:two-component system LytT family sensor kinase
MNTTEKRICFYSALLIALLVNSGRLMALRQNGILARYWQFDLAEYSFQLLYNLSFCGLLFYLNLAGGNRLARYREKGDHLQYYLLNFLIILSYAAMGAALQHAFFADNYLRRVPWPGYLIRFGFSALLVGIISKIILLVREGKTKDSKHEQLKSAYLEAQLELLKEQLNPHFLFNSLSSLSGVVTEDPKMAQSYIFHLSNIFRHSLARFGKKLVAVSDELRMLISYQALLNMRLEDGFRLDIDVKPPYDTYTVPHFSLQPLLENAAKHNSATPEKPLIVQIYADHDCLVIQNNLQPIQTPENSTGIGLVNLNERFRLLAGKEIEIERNDVSFLVKLPLTL